ncbi:MAG: YceD family protein [Candidatus Binatia bacterium]
MRIRLHDIEETSKELVYDESTSELNPLLAHGPVHDYAFAGPATIALTHYRSGQDVFLDGQTRSRVVGQCARCAEAFEFAHDPSFSFILVPRAGRWADEDLEGGGGDMVWYEGDEIDVSPLVRERLMLSLPTLPLCREDCQGLCPQCGRNLNQGACGCPAVGDPRLAILHGLKRGA